MSNGTDKTVKVSFSVDDASAQKAARLFRDLTAQVEKFVAATRQADQAFGGGGGGVFGAKMSNIPGRSGTSSQTQMGHQVVGAGSGLAKTLAGAVQNSAQLFKGAADGSKDAFKIMSDSLKRMVDNSDRDIDRLSTKLKKLGEQYTLLQSRGASPSSPAMKALQGIYYGNASELQAAQKSRGALLSSQGALGTEGDVAGMNGPFGRVRGFFASKGTAIGEGVKSVATGLGIPVAALGGLGVGAAIGAGVKAGLAVASAVRSNEVANLGYSIDQPFFRMNAKATAGNVLGGNALAIRRGDLSRSMAMTAMGEDRDFATIASGRMDRMLSRRRDMEHPDSFLGMLANGFGGGISGTVGGAWGYGMGKIGSLGADIAGNRDVGTTDVNTLAKMRSMQEQQAQKIEMTQRAIEAKMAEDPQFNDRWNSLYGGAIGDLGLSRAAGISGGLQKDFKSFKYKGHTVNAEDVDSVLKLKSVAEKNHYDVSEWVGGMQELAGTAGRGYLRSGPGNLLDMKAGGLGNAASLINVGSQFNGGTMKGAMGFMGGIQGGIGKGGVDVTAASSLLGFGAGQMTGGNFTGGGGGFMQSLLDAAYTGTTGGDMRGSRVAMAGYGEMENRMGGKTDNLQKALNASAVFSATKGTGWLTKQALLDMTPAQLMEYQKTKKVPSSLAVMGVTAGMIDGAMHKESATAFARISNSPSFMKTVSQGAKDDLANYQKSGGLGYLQGKSRAEIMKSINNLSPLLKGATGGGMTLEGAEGLLLHQAVREAGLTGGKGGGAHTSVKKGTARSDAAGEQGLQDWLDARHYADEDKTGKKGINEMQPNMAVSDRSRADSQKAMASGDAGLAIKGVAEALMAFVKTLEGVQGGPRGSGRAASAPH